MEIAASAATVYFHNRGQRLEDVIAAAIFAATPKLTLDQLRYVEEEAARLVEILPFYLNNAATWRGIAAAMGYEPLAHKEARPKGKWLNDRVAMFGTKVITEGPPAPAEKFAQVCDDI